jgi:APA family basic amino acid/polyamine antiporter
MSLYREVGLAAAVFLVVGNIVGIGIFTTSGLIAADLGASPWLMGIWILGGFLALVGAICYSRLGVLFPQAGGEYAFLRPTFGPLAAFLSGWASLFIGFTAPIAASALGLAHYLRGLLPIAQADSALALRLSAGITLLVVGTLISFGLRAGNRLHSLITILNIALLIVFAGLILSKGDPGGNLAQSLAGSIRPASFPALGSAVVLVLFTYSGWNAAAYIGEEIKSPERNLPLALLAGTFTVIVLYGLINLAYFTSVPLNELAGQVAVAEISAEASFGVLGSTLVNILILLSILSSLTAMSIAGPRVYFAMARDRLFPRWLAEVDPKRKIPIRAIWFQTGIALCFVAIGNLYQILVYSGFIMILFSTLTVAALFKVSRYCLLPVIFITANGAVMVSAAFSNPIETAAGLATVAAGLPVYWYYRRLETRNPQQAPEPNR